MHHYFIINPQAGFRDNTATLTAEIAVAFPKTAQVSHYITTGTSQDRQFLQNLCASGEEIRFYACGGDGTIHDVLNAIYPYANASLAVVPCGTGNDYIKSIGGYQGLAHLLTHGTEVRADLIQVNQRICMNIASIGLDANVNAYTTKYKKHPLFKNQAYYLGVATAILRKLGQPLEIALNDKVIQRNMLMMNVAKGHYYGKTFYAAPEAILTDGKLDVCIIDKISHFKLLNVLSVYEKGQHLHNPKYSSFIHYCKTDKVTVSSLQPMVVNVDGELFTETKVAFQVLPQAFRLFSLPFAQEIKPNGYM